MVLLLLHQKRMQMNNHPTNAINFYVDDGAAGVVPALDVTSSIADPTSSSDTHGIKVPFSLTGGTTLGGIARASLNNLTNWQDGHLGNCERLYFTATDFHPTTTFDLSNALWDISGPIGGSTTEPTMAYGVRTWIATKILPVGFQIDSGANINILGNWNPNGGGTDGMSSLDVTATNITTNGRTAATDPSGVNQCTVTVLLSAPAWTGVGPNSALNRNNTTTGLSLTSGMGGSLANGPTVMITIKVVLLAGPPGPINPSIGQGITAAYIDMIRK